jgi:hypothetical protein
VIVFFFKNFFFIDFTQLIGCFPTIYALVKVLCHLKKLRVFPVDVFDILFVITSEDTTVLASG